MEIFSDFNSIKVRLKHSCVAVRPYSVQFQFHKGTIKTNPRTMQQMRQRNFNSIKVRLKPFKL